jgi:hypothetical protein
MASETQNDDIRELIAATQAETEARLAVKAILEDIQKGLESSSAERRELCVQVEWNQKLLLGVYNVLQTLVSIFGTDQKDIEGRLDILRQTLEKAALERDSIRLLSRRMNITGDVVGGDKKEDGKD